ncbi:MAG: (2Fe-2S)-binding protein [Elusimicrobia bacterium]|nr:(2Fe-2S)-binding protein [Elusimicrobiota bacterium]
MKKFPLSCEINGKKIKKEIDSSLRLIDFIREDMGLKGTKEGCGEGECGACMVLLDGKAVNSCLMMAVQIHGKKLVTIEGIHEHKYGKELQDSFVKEAAVQCGFCTPGFIIAAQEILAKNPKASLEEIKEGLAGNLCRCTGYENIFKAVDKARKK